MVCSYCHKDTGHNITTCPYKLREELERERSRDSDGGCCNWFNKETDNQVHYGNEASDVSLMGHSSQSGCVIL